MNIIIKSLKSLIKKHNGRCSQFRTSHINNVNYIKLPKHSSTCVNKFEFESDTFIKVRAPSGRDAMAYILSRRGDKMAVALIEEFSLVEIQDNSLFGGEFSIITGKYDRYTLSSSLTMDSIDKAAADMLFADKTFNPTRRAAE